MKDIRGMSILITGGGSGLGAGMARRYAALSARVTICGRREEKINAVAASIGEACLAVRADITSAPDRARLVDAAVAHGGGLDALINNAGNMYRGTIDALDEQRLLELFHTNVVAAMMMTGLAAEHLSARRGAVIFIGSLGRIGTEEEIAEGIEYLIRAEWTTGAQLDVDGGLGLGTTPF